MVQKLLGTATAIVIAAVSLTACSSTPSESSNGAGTSSPSATTVPSAETSAINCTVTDTWVPTPKNLNAKPISERLGVSVDQVKNGIYGPATCDHNVSMDEIASGTAPRVSIKGQASVCLVMGTQEPPRVGAGTKKILGICPAA